jgi:hypothetical protein
VNRPQRSGDQSLTIALALSSALRRKRLLAFLPKMHSRAAWFGTSITWMPPSEIFGTQGRR